MSREEPKLERRMQLHNRFRVDAYLRQGWRLINRDPLQLEIQVGHKSRQVVTITDGEASVVLVREITNGKNSDPAEPQHDHRVAVRP